MFKPRAVEKMLAKARRTFPAIVVTGPRQSGKTTLLRSIFRDTHRFVSLEDPDVRLRAREDPRGFIAANGPPVIFDEIQYVPELLSYIKTRIDEKRTPGQWLITGSQNFALMAGVSQSLAGRAAVFSLLPFSYAERIGQGRTSAPVSLWLKQIVSRTAEVKSGHLPNLTELILRGNYPEIASKKAVDRQLWCGSYIATYLERDVRNLAQIGDLSQFESFLKICATRTGQILNLSEMARDLGVSVPTARRWLSILETGYQVYLLRPYYRNIGKRLVKSPKLYFNDTALATYLLGIHDSETLRSSPHFGNLFETMIVTDILKRFLHSGGMPAMYYLRTRDGLEVDLALEIGERLALFEIKSSATIVPKHAQGIIRMRHELGARVAQAGVISDTAETFPLAPGITNFNWRNFLAS